MYKFFFIFRPTKEVLLFSRVVFFNLLSEYIDDTFTVLVEINWNPRAGNSYPFIHHSADNFTSCMLFVCALMSFEFFIWSSWSFSKILNNDVGRGKWDFDELNEVLSWIDSSFTHFVVYWFWQGVKCTFRA